MANMPEKPLRYFRETLQSSVLLDVALQAQNLVREAGLSEKSRSSITTSADRIVQAVRLSPNASKLEQLLAHRAAVGIHIPGTGRFLARAKWRGV